LTVLENLVIVNGFCRRDDITNNCSERMAGYKVPDIVEIMAGLPKNASGKVLKKSLRMLLKYLGGIKIERI